MRASSVIWVSSMWSEIDIKPNLLKEQHSTLQMKGPCESNINVRFSDLCIPRNETARPHYFQYRIIMFWVPMSKIMYLWAIYIFPPSVCRVLIVGIYKSLTDKLIMNVEVGNEAAQFHFNICFEFLVQCNGNFKVANNLYQSVCLMSYGIERQNIIILFWK